MVGDGPLLSGLNKKATIIYEEKSKNITMAIYLRPTKKKPKKNKYIEKENANKKEQKHWKKHNRNNKPKNSLSLQTNT